MSRKSVVLVAFAIAANALANDETPGNFMKGNFKDFDKYEWQVELPIKPSSSKLCGSKSRHCAITGSDFFKYSGDNFKVGDSGKSVVLMVPKKKDLPSGLSEDGGPRAELKTGCDVKGGFNFDPTKDGMHWFNVTMAVHNSDEHDLTVAQMHGKARATILVHWTGSGLEASSHGGGFRDSDKGSISSKCWKDRNSMSTKGASQTILKDWKLGQQFTLAMRCGNNKCEFHVNGKLEWTHKFSERDSCSIGDCGIWHTGAYGTAVEVEIFDISYSSEKTSGLAVADKASAESDKLCSDTGKLPKALDIAKWVLEEPSGHGMKIISSPSSHHDEYFGGSDTGVIFCAPGNGGTSAHSQDPRSELRERGYDAQITKGNVRTLEAKVKVLHLSGWPKPSQHAKVVIGQIHGEGNGKGSGMPAELNQLLKLYVKGNGDVVAGVKDDKGNEGSKPFTNIKDDNWTLTYKIELNFDQLTVTANGGSFHYDYSKVLKKYPKVYKTKYWFKAGDYCDPGEDKYRTASEGCKVEFFSLASTHTDSSSEIANITNVMVVV